LAGIYTESFEMRREVDSYSNKQTMSVEQKLAQNKAHELGQTALLYPPKETPKDLKNSAKMQ
jgi:hypothetical protein